METQQPTSDVADRPGSAVWQPCAVQDGEAVRWQIGALRIQAERRWHEWRVTRRHGDDELLGDMERIGPSAPEPEDDGDDANRFGFQDPPATIRLRPRLSDRPFVVRPETPLTLLPDEHVQIYLTTPVWVSVEIGEPPRALIELPSLRPSDTWFGPSTREGELCYASRTRARLRHDDETPPSRAITVATVRNRDDEPLRVDRIAVPIPNLELFEDINGRLWTQSLAVVWKKDGELDDVHIDSGPPPDAIEARPISEARVAVPRLILFRVFAALSF